MSEKKAHDQSTRISVGVEVDCAGHHFIRQVLELLLDNGGLTSTGSTDEQNWASIVGQQVHDISQTNSISSLDSDGREGSVRGVLVTSDEVIP